MAAHEAFPQVPNNDTASRFSVLKNVHVVTITFDGYPLRDTVEAYNDWIVGSDWLLAVGADYGVGLGVSDPATMHFHIADVAPTAITDDEIGTWLLREINDGVIPSPSATLTEPLYAIFYPETTKISGQVGTSCKEYGGYHTSTHQRTTQYAYAVLPTCDYRGSASEKLKNLELAMSHELIEAATDPYPEVQPLFTIADYTTPFYFVPGEVGDLCVGNDMKVGSNWVQRSWSNSAAASNHDPCVPYLPGAGFYYNVTATPNETVVAVPGQVVTYQLKAWSSGPLQSWYVRADRSTGTFDPLPDLNGQQAISMVNGDTATLTLTIPADARPNDYAVVEIYSSLNNASYSSWPVAVYVSGP
jgi:hypothetical protein